MLLSAAEACKNVVSVTNDDRQPFTTIIEDFNFKAFKNTLVNDILNIGRREGLEEHEQVRITIVICLSLQSISVLSYTEQNSY